MSRFLSCIDQISTHSHTVGGTPPRVSLCVFRAHVQLPCTLGSCPKMPLASVEMVWHNLRSKQLGEAMAVEILTAPLRLASCSPTQPAAPALGLSAGAGLTPPVKRFAAAGRPAFICSTARLCSKTPSNAMEIGSVSAPAHTPA